MEKHLGIIGSGNFGQFIIRAAEGLDVETSVIDGEKAVEILRKHPATHVVIATPNHTHTKLVRSALKLGKHVLCEKPLALTMTDVKYLYTLASEKNRYLGVEFVLPNHIFYQRLKDLQLEYGNIVSMRIINNATEGTLKPEWYWNKEQSGGWFMVSEIHWYHLFAWLIDAETLDVHEAREEKMDGRTIATKSLVYSPKGQELAVTHRIDADYETAWCKVEMEFLKEKIIIDDWVPKAIDTLKFDPKINLPETFKQVGKKFTDTRGRDAIYRHMVRSNLEKLLSEEKENPIPVMVAHEAALTAQKLSDAE